MDEQDEIASGSRHLALDNLDLYWAADVPVELPLFGEPVCRLRFNPLHDEISLLTPLLGPEPELSQFHRLTLSTFIQDGESWAELRIAVADSLHSAYILLASIADHLQVRHESLALAVSLALEEHRSLLESRTSLSQE